MKMKISRLTVVTTILALLPMVLGAVLYSSLPEVIVTHWGMGGEPNGWSPRWMGCFGLPAIMGAGCLVVGLAMDNMAKPEGVSGPVGSLCRWMIPVLSMVLVPVTLYYSLGVELNVERIVCTLVGVLFVAVGNYLPKCRRNSVVGIKLPWTLASDENWDRTHRLSGYIWMACGILMLLGTWLLGGWLTAVVLPVMITVPVVYSYTLHRRGV